MVKKKFTYGNDDKYKTAIGKGNNVISRVFDFLVGEVYSKSIFMEPDHDKLKQLVDGDQLMHILPNDTMFERWFEDFAYNKCYKISYIHKLYKIILRIIKRVLAIVNNNHTTASGCLSYKLRKELKENRKDITFITKKVAKVYQFEKIVLGLANRSSDCKSRIHLVLNKLTHKANKLSSFTDEQVSRLLNYCSNTEMYDTTTPKRKSKNKHILKREQTSLILLLGLLTGARCTSDIKKLTYLEIETLFKDGVVSFLSKNKGIATIRLPIINITGVRYSIIDRTLRACFTLYNILEERLNSRYINLKNDRDEVAKINFFDISNQSMRRTFDDIFQQACGYKRPKCVSFHCTRSWYCKTIANDFDMETTKYCVNHSQIGITRNYVRRGWNERDLSEKIGTSISKRYSLKKYTNPLHQT